jgi:enoyl-CoA hydratase
MGRALEMILTGRVIEAGEARDWGLVNEVVDQGRHLDRALEIAEGLARFPQPTMLSDRQAALEGIGMPFAEGLAREAELGRESVATGVLGAARFAGGEGRGAAGAGV